jgi:hypothetical protein
MPGQRSSAELVTKHNLHSESMRALFTDYLAERAAELDYASLLQLSNTLCGLFWRDLERHHPGIDSLRLSPDIAAAWKQRLRHIRDQDGQLIGERVSARSQLLIVRAFYLDIARWAAEEPSRWAVVGAVPDQGQRVLAGQGTQAPQGRHGSAHPRATAGPARARAHSRT